MSFSLDNGDDTNWRDTRTDTRNLFVWILIGVIAVGAIAICINR